MIFSSFFSTATIQSTSVLLHERRIDGRSIKVPFLVLMQKLVSTCLQVTLFCFLSLQAQAQSWSVTAFSTPVTPLVLEDSDSDGPKYCLLLPQELSDDVKAEIKGILRDALSYWSRELSQISRSDKKQLALGLNTWQEVPCPEGDSDKTHLVVSFDPTISRQIRDLYTGLGKPLSVGFQLKTADPFTRKGVIILSESWLPLHNQRKLSESSVANLDKTPPDAVKLERLRWNLVHEFAYFAGYMGSRWGWEASNFSNQIFSRSVTLDKIVPPLLLNHVDFSSCSNESCIQVKGPNQDGKIALVKTPHDPKKNVSEVATLKLESSALALFFDRALVQSDSDLKSWSWSGPVKIYRSEKSKDFSTGFLTVSPYSLHLVSGGAKKVAPKLMFNLKALSESSIATDSLRGPAWKGENLLNPRSTSSGTSEIEDVKASSLAPIEPGSSPRSADSVKTLRGEAKRRAGVYIRERDPNKAQKYLGNDPSP